MEVFIHHTGKLRLGLISSGLASVIFLAGIQPAQAVSTQIEVPQLSRGQGSFGFSLASEYFTTEANYDSYRGSFVRLTGDNSLTSFESTLRAQYGVTQRFTVFTGLGYSQVRAVDAVNEKTNAGLTEAFVGANFLIWKKWAHVIPEIQASYPIDETVSNQTVPLTSDGVMYARAGVFVLKPFKWFRLQSYLGIHFPTEGLAKLALYSIGGEVPLGRPSRFAIGASLDGYETLISDELTLAERRQTTLAANAGSQRFYAFDPALMEGRLWASFTPDRGIRIRAGYAKTIDGIRAAEGQSFLLSVSFHSVPKNRHLIEAERQERIRRKRAEAAKKFEATPAQSETEYLRDDSLDETERMLEKE